MDKNSNLWYDKLNKSKLTPPNWVFGVVWPILYILMFIALFKIWTNNKCKPYCSAITLFLIQLGLNLSWSPIFFKLKKIKLSLIILIALIVFAFITYNKFKIIDNKTSLLFLPYLLWISFAFYLNLYIVIKN